MSFRLRAAGSGLRTSDLGLRTSGLGLGGDRNCRARASKSCAAAEPLRLSPGSCKLPGLEIEMIRRMTTLCALVLLVVPIAGAVHDEPVSSKDGLVVCSSAPACDVGATIL